MNMGNEEMGDFADNKGEKMERVKNGARHTKKPA